ncbi:hypothetical protein [Streptomyces silaceus]|uniref:hypothetical protein n=1 Tax=Streptomyces silaceus TaxID=545123 RepID=UPI0006EBA4DA|nr:hypothetical protein [Streptomyces silaceus]
MPFAIKAELLVGAVWVDVSGDIRYDTAIRIQRGRSDESQQVESSRCSLVLDNNAGAYSPKNPVGPYYGQIGRNTPIRISVLTGSTYLDLPGGTADYAETPDTAALDIVGDLDVRLDATLANWVPPLDSTTADAVEMIGKFGSGQKSWFLGSRQGRLYFEWSADGSASLAASSTVAPVVPGAGGRLAVRVTLDVNNGSGGWTVRFFTADNLDAPWTQLGDPVSGAGVTSIFNSTAPLRIGNATGFILRLPIGRVHGAEVRNGLWGTIVAQPRFNAQAAGTTSFADSAGRTWTLAGGTSITNKRVRFAGEVTSWAPRWESKHDLVTQVEAYGVMRRLTQGTVPVRSAMYREFTNPSRTSIVSYWPMEDEAAATTFASALDGQPAMPVPAAGVAMAAYADWVASAPLPTFTYGVTRVKVAPYTATNFTFLRFGAAVPAGGVTGTDRIFSVSMTGTARTWSLFVNTSGSLELRAYDADGTQILASGFGTFAINGVPRHIGIELTQNGANIDWRLIVLKIDESRLSNTVSSFLSGTLNAYTAGSATDVRIGQDGLLNGTAIGHVAVASSSTAYSGTINAMIGWREETASNRVQRLGIEEGLPAYSASLSEQRLGVQGQLTLLELMREAAAADEGILCEERSFLGLRLRDRASLYNQAPALTLDYTGSDGLVSPLEPTDDDQQPRNDITVQRTGGSSARRTLESGPMSAAAPPAGIGRYPESVTLNVADDAQLGDHAGWQLHVGTVDETRYPVVRMLLAKAAHLVEAAAAVDIGDRMKIVRPWELVQPDDLDLMVQGYSESLDQFMWNIDFNTTPASPWDVAWVGDTNTASSFREFMQWTDTDGSALAEALTSSQSTATVVTTAGPVWTPYVRDTPFDWRVSGEVMTVLAPSTLLSPNPFFETDISGWTAQSATATWSKTYVHPHPRALGSLRIVPDGVTSVGGALGDFTAVGSVTPGATYVLSGWVFCADGWSDVQVCPNWYDAGGTLVSSVAGTGVAVGASVWTWVEQEFVAPAGASRAKVRVRHGGTPPSSAIYYVWAPRIARKKSSFLYDDFGRTASSTWGTSDSGLAWNQVGGGAASDYNVNAALYATHILSTLDISRRSAVTAVHPDFDLYCDVTTSAAASGDSLYGGPTARMVDANNMYMARLEFRTTGTIILTVRAQVAGTGTGIGSSYTLPFTHTPGSFVRVRFQGKGTTFRARAWRAGDMEPGIWHIEGADAAFSAAAQIGTRSIRSTGNTNLSTVEVRYARFDVINPQVYSVRRSQNRVIKSQALGAAVSVANTPAFAAL